MIQFFSDSDLTEQMLLENEHCVVILPHKPVFKNHFMITPKRKEAHVFTDLSTSELQALRDLTKQVVETFQSDASFNYSGYNLFCNNGEQASQHVNQFHMHLFMRSFDESDSPYDLMNKNKHWQSKDSIEWQEHRDLLRSMLKRTHQD